MQRSKKNPDKIISVKSPNKDQEGRLYVHDMFTVEGCPYYVTSFPTRSMVCGRQKYSFTGGSERSKFRVRDVKWLSVKNALRRSKRYKNPLRRSERRLLGRALAFGSTMTSRMSSTPQIDRERRRFLRAVTSHRRVMRELHLVGVIIS